jgi:hypothetical protein
MDLNRPVGEHAFIARGMDQAADAMMMLLQLADHGPAQKTGGSCYQNQHYRIITLLDFEAIA